MNPTAAVAHLYRRAGFGATPSQVAASSANGYGATVDHLIAGLGAPDPAADAVAVPTLTAPPTDFRQLLTDPAARSALDKSLAAERVALINWWLARMVASDQPLHEKLTFLLHGQFPTAISKVRFPIYMYDQNQLFRSQGAGNFTVLTEAVAAGPAMLIWLDAGSDNKADPNENFARELMERFTMGIGTYSQDDVRAAAYCFTGWRVGRGGTFTVDSEDHSTVAQTFLGTSGVTTGQQVIDLATKSAASARYVPACLWSHLAYPVATNDRVVDDLSPAYAADRNITSLLKAIFEHPLFTSTAATTGLVKQPTEYMVGALRALGFTASDVVGHKLGQLAAMAGMGQILFDPPSVGGWGQNEYWLSTSAALARWKFAHELCRVADLSPISDVAPGSRVEAAASLLAVSSWSGNTNAVLTQAGGDPATLMTLAMVSPEYVAN
jgi:uncharacterized protein (DUF1800 family)